MKIIITAGGGGHFAPALAVIKELQKKGNIPILFIGRKHALEGDSALSLEYQTVKKLDIPFRTITAGRLQRTLSFRSIRSLCKIPVGFMQAYRILSKEKPDRVLSFGGYIALPVTIAARMLRIPVVIHEQTMRAGLANRIAGTFAQAVCLSYETSARYFPKGKTILTGNPLREGLRKPVAEKAFFSESLPILFVTGGSLGSHVINVLIENLLEKFLSNYQLIHQTGDAQEYTDFARLEERREKLMPSLKRRYHLMRFIEPDMIGSILKQSDLVIARAGMSTITELIYFQKPSLLIPLPHGQKNEQQENAKYLASLGLAKIMKQEDATPETMYTNIEAMFAELGRYKLNRDISSLIREDAAEKIITAVFSHTEDLRAQNEEKTRT